MRICFLVVLVLVFSLAIISCQKEIDPFVPQTGTDSTDVPVDTSSAGQFQPVTVGSFWKYKDSASGTESITSIGDSTTIINNILFKEYLSASSTPDTAWIASPGPKYYLVKQTVIPGSVIPLQLTFYYLNDTASEGYTWQYTAGSTTGITINTKNTLVAKGLSISVEGKTYSDVTQTHVDLSYIVLGTETNISSYDYFMAKGVGFIKIRLTTIGTPDTQSCSNLVDYEIK